MVRYSQEQRKKWLSSLDARPSSSAILFENESGQVLALKANYKDYWSLVGGVIDAGESPLEAAIRETQEETGIEVTSDLLSFMAIGHRESSGFLLYQMVFYAKVENSFFDNMKLQDSEIEASRLVSREDIMSARDKFSWPFHVWADGLSGYFELERSDDDGTVRESIVRHIGLLR